ncbi:MAG: C40 family peptidase [Heyndrickxia sp.]
MGVTLKKKSFLSVIVAIFTFTAAFLLVPFSKASATINYGEEVAAVAQLYNGAKFKMGGNTPNGFDASGFTKYVYKDAATKMTIPRTSADQYKVGKSVELKSLQQGDLVFYATGEKKGKVSFVAIYIGNGNFIGATSKGVKIVKMSDKYWKERYVGAKRIIK